MPLPDFFFESGKGFQVLILLKTELQPDADQNTLASEKDNVSVPAYVDVP